MGAAVAAEATAQQRRSSVGETDEPRSPAGIAAVDRARQSRTKLRELHITTSESDDDQEVENELEFQHEEIEIANGMRI